MGLVQATVVYTLIPVTLKALCQLAVEAGVDNNKLFIHAFTDGRDTDRKRGQYVGDLDAFLKSNGGHIASPWWDDTMPWTATSAEAHQKAATTCSWMEQARHSQIATEAIETSYAAGVTDEFIEPAVLTDENGQAVATIAEGRYRHLFQLPHRPLPADHPGTHPGGFRRSRHTLTIPLHYVTMTRYDHTFKGVEVIFENEDIVDTIGEVLERNNRKQIRIAETENIRVTFFFSGGREKEFTGETRIMRILLGVATWRSAARDECVCVARCHHP